MFGIGLNNRLYYLAVGVLISCFVLAFVFAVVPELPNYPVGQGERRSFVSTWNFACTLMWITIFRIQVLNEMLDSLERTAPGRRVTPWVKFWFIASASVGAVAITYVSRSFASWPSSTPFDLLTAISVFFWLVLACVSALIFLRRQSSSVDSAEVKKALSVHRVLLAPTSLIFAVCMLMFPSLFSL